MVCFEKLRFSFNTSLLPSSLVNFDKNIDPVDYNIPVHITAKHTISKNSTPSTRTKKSRNLTNLRPLKKATVTNLDRSLPNFMLLNAQSISHKIDERSVHVDLLRSDIIYVIETWLTDFIPDEIIQIKGYSNVRRDRTNDISGGGVSLYIRENIPFKIRTDLQHRSIECLWITIRPKWLPRNISQIAIATVYLYPHQSQVLIWTNSMIIFVFASIA